MPVDAETKRYMLASLGRILVLTVLISGVSILTGWNVFLVSLLVLPFWIAANYFYGKKN